MIFPIEDIAALSIKDRTHANIGALLFGLRDAVEQLIAIRVREFGPLLDGEEQELTAINQSLQWLLSDIQAMRGHIKRNQKAPK